MKHYSRIVIAFISLILIAVAAAQTAEEVIAANQKAEGADIKAKFKTLVTTAKMTVAYQEGEATRTVYKKRPDKIRIEIEAEGYKLVMACDGKEGWGLAPRQKKAESMDSAEVDEFKQNASIDGELATYKSKGLTATLIGKVTRDSVETNKIVLKNKDDKEIATYFIDTKTNLVYQTMRDEQGQGGRLIKVISTFSDYRDVNGAQYAFQVSQNMGSMIQIYTVESIEADTGIADALFAKPK